MSDLRETTGDAFATEVLAASVPVLVEFTAPGCRPCRALEPVLQSLVQEADGHVELVALDVEKHPDVAARYGVLSIPTTVLFADGASQATVIGAASRRQLETAFDPWLRHPQ